MMTAYLDESGQEQKDGRMVIAGFAGTEDQWVAFESAWRAAIKPRTHLHVTDLRFQKDRDRRLLERAGVLPEQFQLMPLAGSVNFADYSDLVTGTEDERIYPGYLASLQPLLINALRGLPDGEMLEVVFERQDRYWELTDQAIRVFQAISHPELSLPNGTSKLVSWRWAEKNATSRTEPADFLAFALLQAYRDRNSKKAQWCSPILPSDGELYGRPLTRDMVRRIVLRAQDMHRARGLWPKS